MKPLRIYLDTQIINYMRKEVNDDAISLRKFLVKKHKKFDLYYSSAHFADYQRDKTVHKEEDLAFMNDTGIIYFLFYDVEKKQCFDLVANPLELYYDILLNEDRIKEKYKYFSKPILDRHALFMYEWYKTTLVQFENDSSYLSSIDEKDSRVFLDINKQINLNSKKLTQEKYLKFINKYWNEVIYTLPDKEASKYALEMTAIENNALSYYKDTIKLTESNLVNQIKNTQFKKDFNERVTGALRTMGIDFKKNYDQYFHFVMTYSMLPIYGIERDKNKKFNVYSSRNDALHFHLSSTCHVLITEDFGFYRRAKIGFGLLGITTKIYSIKEFLSVYKN